MSERNPIPPCLSHLEQMAGPRFFLGRDQSSHWYLVPLEHRAEWLAWTEIPENDERSWEPPAFARMIDGPTISFTDPKDI